MRPGSRAHPARPSGASQPVTIGKLTQVTSPGPQSKSRTPANESANDTPAECATRRDRDASPADISAGQDIGESDDRPFNGSGFEPRTPDQL